MKIRELPLGAFFDWRELPIGDASLDPLAFKKLKGHSDVHLNYFKDAGLAYPPDLSSLPRGFRDAVCRLPPSAIEVSIYGEETDCWPVIPDSPQWADVNMGLKFHIGANPNGVVFRATVPTLTTHSILLMRVLDTDLKKHWRVVSGEYLLRLMGYFGANAELVSDESPTQRSPFVGSSHA